MWLRDGDQLLLVAIGEKRRSVNAGAGVVAGERALEDGVRVSEVGAEPGVERREDDAAVGHGRDERAVVVCHGGRRRRTRRRDRYAGIDAVAGDQHRVQLALNLRVHV